MQQQILFFLESGGIVLWVILSLNLGLWCLVFERFIYLNIGLPKNTTVANALWSHRTDKKSWRALKIKTYLISKIELSLDHHLHTIRTITMVFPLLGLLGTVTGMIEVFNVISVTGGGDAKPMAYGISRATIPTMAGMVSAIAALLAYNTLRSATEHRKQAFSQSLSEKLHSDSTS